MFKLIFSLSLILSSLSHADATLDQAKMKQGLRLEEKTLGALIMAKTIAPEVGELKFRPDSFLWKHFAQYPKEAELNSSAISFSGGFGFFMMQANYLKFGLVNPSGSFALQGEDFMSASINFSGAGVLLPSAISIALAWAGQDYIASKVVKLMQTDKKFNLELAKIVNPWSHILRFTADQESQLKVGIKNDLARQILTREGSYSTQAIHYDVDLFKIILDLKLADKTTLENANQIISQVIPTDKVRDMTLDDVYNIDIQLAENLKANLTSVVQQNQLKPQQQQTLKIAVQALDQEIHAAKAFQGAIK